MFILQRDRAEFEMSADFPAELVRRYDAYHDYLDSIRPRLPQHAAAFAFAPWHHNPSDHRCPHDAWVEALTIREPASGDRQHIRGMALHLRLLGAYHDGHIEITYHDVHRYDLHTPREVWLPPRGDVGHGDWLYDEIRLSDAGDVLHEIEFSRGSHWLIECDDLRYEWLPLSS